MGKNQFSIAGTEGNLLTLQQASQWAAKYLKKNISVSNISYLVQYGKVKKRSIKGATLISKDDLIKYYNSFHGKREIKWKKELGKDLNWNLSFDHLREKDTTKHVHRLHPYKGKFIPQLVEYFLDDHVDALKKETYFKKGDIILDPFCGSGTTLIQTNELGMHCIGIDISAFNILIANVKIGKYDFFELKDNVSKISHDLFQFSDKTKIPLFEQELLDKLYIFNNKYFPSPDFRYKVNKKEIDELKYGEQKAKIFFPIYKNLIKKYAIKLTQKKSDTFIDKWYIRSTRDEIDLAFGLVKNVKNNNIKKILTVILSRAIRSCRATTHSDLATLKAPQVASYYCIKHKKICKPLFSIRQKWNTYSKDTLSRLEIFKRLMTDTYQISLKGDSRNLNIIQEVQKKKKNFSQLLKKNKISGIFSSPPYVGLINYHEQHAYAYDLYGFQRNDESEIGPLFRGQGEEARKMYVNGIADVLINCKKFMVKNYNIFLVANDKHNLYPIIADKAGMKIKNQFKRPVLNRTERDKGSYSEIIFHLKSK